jgi:hypothetical protein
MRHKPQHAQNCGLLAEAFNAFASAPRQQPWSVANALATMRNIEDELARAVQVSIVWRLGRSGSPLPYNRPWSGHTAGFQNASQIIKL